MKKTTSTVNHVEVQQDRDGQRLDNFLMAQLKGVPRSLIYRIIRTGQVRVNGGRAKPASKLQTGDVVRIPPASVRSGKVADIPPKVLQLLNRSICFEDQHIMVIDKPAGMAVHGGSGISSGAIEQLRQARPDSHFLELVHRLDRDTSGLLLVAKKRSALRKLHAAFREGEVHKRYETLLLGAWEGG